MSRLADFLWHVMTHGSPTVWNMRRTKWQKLSKDIQTQHSVEVTSTGCVRVSNFLETRVSPQLFPCDWQFAPISGHIVLKHIKYSECADDEGPQFPCAGHKATYLWSLPLRTLLHTLPLKLETRENFNQACCIVQWWKSPNIHISSFTVKGISQRPSETPDKATDELEQQARWPLGSNWHRLSLWPVGVSVIVSADPFGPWRPGALSILAYAASFYGCHMTFKDSNNLFIIWSSVMDAFHLTFQCIFPFYAGNCTLEQLQFSQYQFLESALNKPSYFCETAFTYMLVYCSGWWLSHCNQHPNWKSLCVCTAQINDSFSLSHRLLF